jgi:hypothetical protein
LTLTRLGFFGRLPRATSCKEWIAEEKKRKPLRMGRLMARHQQAEQVRIGCSVAFNEAPARTTALSTIPTFVSGWDTTALKARLVFGAPDQAALTPPETALERLSAL